MNCWNCHALLPASPWNRISFREICPHCHHALHCCRNCSHYKPGMPNDCAVPNTDPISDRAASNFCEEFKLKVHEKTAQLDPNEVENRLFKDENSDAKPKDSKNKFDSLFND